MSDLWSSTAQERTQAAHNNARRINNCKNPWSPDATTCQVSVAEVLPLTTGLWYGWLDTKGRLHKVLDYQLQELLRDK